MVKRAYLVAVLAVSVSSVAAASSNDVALTVGVGSSSVSPEIGGVLSLRYARSVSPRLAWFVSPELVVNLGRPDGRLTKGGAAGLDVGLQRGSALGHRFLLVTDAAIGPRLFAEPGFGVAARVGVGIGVPIATRLALLLGVSGEAGIGRIGDEAPKTKALLRADVWTRVGRSW